MELEKDSDAELMVDWRRARAKPVASMPLTQTLRQSHLSYREEKILHTTHSAKSSSKVLEERNTIQQRSNCMGSPGAAKVPVVCLSDSDGTPGPRRLPLYAPERTAKAKAVKVCNFEVSLSAPNLRSDNHVIVNLDSDSDEEIYKKAASGTQERTESPKVEISFTNSRIQRNDPLTAPGTTKLRTSDDAIHSSGDLAADFQASPVCEGLTAGNDDCSLIPGLVQDRESSTRWETQKWTSKASVSVVDLENDLMHDEEIKVSWDSRSSGDLSTGFPNINSCGTPEKVSRKRSGDVLWADPVGELDDNNVEQARPRGRPPKRIPRGDPEARLAEKQKERELKKARQEQEKKEREEKKKQREAAKAEATEKKRQEKELDKWAKGTRALEHTTVRLDSKVVEMRNLNSILLYQLNEKKYNYNVISNPIEKSILWTMKRPAVDSQRDIGELGTQDDDPVGSQPSSSQLMLEEVEVKYIVIVFQDEDFANMVAEGRHHEHFLEARKQYPGYSICYAISGLMKYLKQREQQQYKAGNTGWKRPNVEQALAELVIYHTDVQTRLCTDESEIADLIVGLTRGHAQVPFKQKLSSISVGANGDHVTNKDPNRLIIKKNIWLKFLVSIPLICGATAIAISKEYPTMRDLFNVYRDRSISEISKAFLLQNIIKDVPLGSANPEGRRVGRAASMRIFRVLTAQNGNLNTKDVEDGADYFRSDVE